MPVLASKKFATLVGDFAAATQGAARQLLDFTIGSILRAVSEATGGVGLWLQGLCYQVLAATRLATSTGTDVDTWVGDFGLTRLAAVAATGLVTFSRFTPTLQAVVPIGAKVATTDGSQSFLVYVDTANAAYNAALGGYVAGPGVASVAVPVRAANAGIQGNITASSITLLNTGISGIDTVLNSAPFINGVDAESDAALRARFVLYILSLRAGTPGAIGYAIVSTQQGLQYTINENVDPDLVTTDYGVVSVYVDDGSGSIPSAVLTAVTNNVAAIRAAGVRVGVFAATVLTANVVLTITTAAGYDHPTVVGQVGNAIGAYINALGLGNKLPYTRLEQVAYDASPGVINVTSITINGGTADLVPTKKQTVKSGTITIS